jgi:hypothetical protein
MAAWRAAALLPLLVPGCAADPGEEAAALMRQALSTTQASLAVAGRAPMAGVTAPGGTAAAGGANAAGGATAAGGTATAGAPPSPGGMSRPAALAAPPAIAPGPRLTGRAPPAAAAALVGAPAEQMRRMLGDPALRRAEGEAEIWLYEAAPCRLDVVLYAQGAALVVAHAAARAHGPEGVTEAACLSAIATAPNIAPWINPGRRA